MGERRRLAMRVRDILSNSEQHYLSIENVAEYLHMSDRTLKRQLAAEGTSFSTLVDEVRYRHATSLLSRTDYSLEQIADELGYSDVANFSRAFKRWSGRSPVTGAKTPIYNVIKILDTCLRSCHEPPFRIEVCTYT